MAASRIIGYFSWWELGKRRKYPKTSEELEGVVTQHPHGGESGHRAFAKPQVRNQEYVWFFHWGLIHPTALVIGIIKLDPLILDGQKVHDRRDTVEQFFKLSGK